MSPAVPPFISELLRLPESRRVLRVSNPPQSWSTKEILELTEYSFSLRFSDPWKMLEFAKLACALAEAIGRRGSEGKDYDDACAEAWAQLGNANKV
jgi:hypothetical protein